MSLPPFVSGPAVKSNGF